MMQTGKSTVGYTASDPGAGPPSQLPRREAGGCGLAVPRSRLVNGIHDYATRDLHLTLVFRS